MKQPELIPTSLKIDKIINRIDEGEIKIPAFQRGYVWKQNQVIELLESITNQYPIGSALLWEAGEKEKLKATRNIAGYIIPDKGENWPVNYVLDGQQRLSSIYAVFSTKIEQDQSNEKYNPDLDIFEIYYDFSENKYIPSSEADIQSSSIVKLRNIVDPLKLFDELNHLDKRYHNEAKTLSSKFLNYEVPIVQIKNRTKEEVGLIFERINNTGTKLNTLDLMTAWTWNEEFHLLDSIDSLLDELDEKGFGKIDPKLVLQIVSAIIIGSTKTENILRLTGDRVRENWQKITEALKLTVDFLATQVNCNHIEFLPSHQQIIPLSRFFSRIKSPTADQIAALKKYFWRTSFSDRYSTGQTTEKMDSDIEAIDKSCDYDFSAIEKQTITVTTKELISNQFSKANPLTRSFLLLSSQLSPMDLISAERIDLGRALSSYNRKEYHHVFPNAFLSKQGTDKAQRFSIVNFCFLPAKSNKKISSKSPSDYFFSLIPNDKLQEILYTNLLPADMSLYKNNNYTNFLEKRAQLILEKIVEISK